MYFLGTQSNADAPGHATRDTLLGISPSIAQCQGQNCDGTANRSVKRGGSCI